MKRVLVLLPLLVFLVALGAVGAALVMSDEDLEGALSTVPGGEKHADQIIGMKGRAGDMAGGLVDGVMSSLSSLTEPAEDTRPRVVIELEPVQRPPEPPAQITSPAEPGVMNEGAAPMQLAPKTMTAPEPETPKPEPAEMSPAPPPAPEPLRTPARAEEPEPVKSAETAAAPKMEKPKPEPPAKADDKAKQMSAAAKKTKPAPPPAAPTADSGEEEHKEGLSHYKGVGVKKNYKTAHKLFETAAAKGNAASQYNLGIMSYLGQGTDQDYQRAAEWFRMAAEQDHTLAQYNLGFLYHEGKGVEKDSLQAFMWIDRAASLGDEKAIKARDTLAKILPKDIHKKQP